VADAEWREAIEVIKAKLGAATADSAQIDRDRSWQAKRDALEIIFSVPRTPGREASFAAYRRREGRGLQRFANWAALSEEYGPNFSDWPAELQDPQAAAVAALCSGTVRQDRLHRWLQWLMDEHWPACSRRPDGPAWHSG
jgi:4-alpha-glucanotransferase